MAKIQVVVTDGSATFQRNWGWLLALGILFVILGCIGMGMVVGLTIASVLFLGVILLIAGISQVVDVFTSKQWRGAVWHALIAILYILGGGVVIYDPILASTLITVLIAWMLIIIGVTRLIMANSLRSQGGWGWLIFAGLTAIILGVLILLQWPYSGLWVLGLFIAIELIINGWTYIFLALAGRRS
ncbi:MAG: HdeD family acid-resistance protein [Legionellales bacterium]|nr:HdeD family acid-resistance protein [Legionellales bacterium]